MANGRDLTESGPIELPKKKEGWIRFIKPAWWLIISAVGVYAFFHASKDIKEPHYNGQKADAGITSNDASATRSDTGHE